MTGLLGHRGLLFGTGAGSGGGSSAVYLWDSSDKSAGITLSGGDLIATVSAGTDQWRSIISDTAIASGKWYWEIPITEALRANGDNVLVGVSDTRPADGSFVGNTSGSYAYYQSGVKFNGGTPTGFGATYTTGDVIQVAVDTTAGKVWFGKNNTWQGGGNPGAGTGEAYSGLSGTKYAACSLFRGVAPPTKITAAFAAADQTYSPPSGFSALSL